LAALCVVAMSKAPPRSPPRPGKFDLCNGERYDPSRDEIPAVAGFLEDTR